MIGGVQSQRWRRTPRRHPVREITAPLGAWRELLAVEGKPVGCFDFDGTMAVTGPYRPGIPTASPSAEMIATLKWAHDYVRVVVLTARPCSEVWPWLAQYGLTKYVDEVTNTKPPALFYVDDRAVEHDGNWKTTRGKLEQILGYSPDQPRVPQGSPGGGQWTDGDGTTVEENVSVSMTTSIANEPTVAPSMGHLAVNRDPTLDANRDGVADCARVGVCGDEVPNTIPRLANLTADERAVEERFAAAFERNPDGVARNYMAQVMTNPKAPNTFSTDDAKLLSPDYQRTAEGKSLYNIAVHQTSNAIAKRAFVMYLDEVVAKNPPDKRSVLVTAGGCAAGKGFCLKSVDETKSIAGQVGAIWDTAGEQNSTELPWVLQQCKQRGIQAIFAYVDADPLKSYARVISRAKDPKDGRMVDAQLFTDSYVEGAKNFNRFADAHKNEALFVFLSNRGDKPRRVPMMPMEALKTNAKDILKGAVTLVRDADAPAFIKRGGLVGQRIFRTAAA